jgi:hypothetical protein
VEGETRQGPGKSQESPPTGGMGEFPAYFERVCANIGLGQILVWLFKIR